jgi:hypothetical protein
MDRNEQPGNADGKPSSSLLPHEIGRMNLQHGRFLE